MESRLVLNSKWPCCFGLRMLKLHVCATHTTTKVTFEYSAWLLGTLMYYIKYGSWCVNDWVLWQCPARVECSLVMLISHLFSSSSHYCLHISKKNPFFMFMHFAAFYGLLSVAKDIYMTINLELHTGAWWAHQYW